MLSAAVPMRQRCAIAVPALLGAYLICVPVLLSVLLPTWPSYDAARVVQLALLMLAAILGWGLVLPRASRTIVGLGLALLACLLLSCMQALNPAMALRELLLFGSLGATAALLASAPAASCLLLSRVAALAVAAYALPVVGMAVVGAAQGLPWHLDSLLTGFANRRALNHVQTVALPLAIWAAVWAPSRGMRMLAGSGVLASSTLLWLSAGRGTLLACIGALATMAVLCTVDRKAAWPTLRGFAAALLLGGVLAFGLSAAATSGAKQDESVAVVVTSDNSRFALWQRAWDMASSAPWLGAGPMHYALGHHEKAAHPHNMTLQIAAEWGFPALIFALLLGWSLLRALLQRLRIIDPAMRPLGICLLAAWVAVLVDSQFSGIWVMPVSQTWLAALLGLSLAWLRLEAPPIQAERRVVKALPALLALSLLMLVLPEAKNIHAHLAAVKSAFPADASHPRFWSHGHFGSAS